MSLIWFDQTDQSFQAMDQITGVSVKVSTRGVDPGKKFEEVYKTIQPTLDTAVKEYYEKQTKLAEDTALKLKTELEAQKALEESKKAENFHPFAKEPVSSLKQVIPLVKKRGRPRKVVVINPALNTDITVEGISIEDTDKPKESSTV